MNVDAEVELLCEQCRRLGRVNAQGAIAVKFGVLVRDETCANTFEAINGTLRAAKKRKKLTFVGEMLLQGVSDDVDIILLN